METSGSLPSRYPEVYIIECILSGRVEDRTEERTSKNSVSAIKLCGSRQNTRSGEETQQKDKSLAMAKTKGIHKIYRDPRSGLKIHSFIHRIPH